MADLVTQGKQLNINNNDGVKGFREYVSSCNIVSYTTHERSSKYGNVTGNLINANLEKNYNGGTMLLAHPSSDENSVFYKYDGEKESFFDLERSSLDGIDVGDFFSLKNNSHYSNANKNSITEDGFLKFEGAIREGNIMQKYVFRPDSDYLQLVNIYSNLSNYKEPNSDLMAIRAAEEDTIANYYKDYISIFPNYRQEISSELSKKGLLSTITNNWNVYETPETIEYYSIDGKWSLDGNINIGFGGKGLTHVLDGKRTYETYDEPGSTNSNFIGEVTHGNVYKKLNSSELNGYSDIIRRTNRMFQEKAINSIVNRFHTDNGIVDDELSTGSKYGLSRGRNLLTESAENGNGGEKINGYDNPYCRVWTAHHQYSKLSRRIRPFYNGDTAVTIGDTQANYGSGLRPNGNYLGKHTVLTDQGFVRMTPTSDKGRDIKKCMFSIENLAWRDIDLDSAGISKEQQGPNKGRIMWFPPYNLKFTENVNVDWNANKFIGRGEQIYTYTNTDRSGTLNFTLLIDHPSMLNKFVGKNTNGGDEVENQILRYFAGCNNLEGSSDGGAGKLGNESEVSENTDAKRVERTKDIAYVAFFPHNWSGRNYKDNVLDGLDKLREYETSNSNQQFNEIDTGATTFTDSPINSSSYHLNDFSRNSAIKDDIKKRIFHAESDDNENFDVISIFDSQSGITKLGELLKDGNYFNCGANHQGGADVADGVNLFEIESIEAFGSASSHGKEQDHDGSKNDLLALRRVQFLFGVALKESRIIDSTLIKGGYLHTITDVNDIGEEDINTKDAKMARYAYLIFHIKWNEENVPSDLSVTEDQTVSVSNYGELNSTNVSSSDDDENLKTVQKTVTEPDGSDYTYDNEYKYFQEARDNEMVYKYIAQKVQYFDPAYHSVTPEGFNARLTFLHQCTRQGPTTELSSGRITSEDNDYLKYAGNLAFGRPPYCILRIGDFYYTKICITSMSIDYDTGSGIQWDLNQEGIGVQPMFANVSLNFNFIGGHSLEGPIERLQNAVTYNYYANTPVYDKNSDADGEIKDVTVKKRKQSDSKTQETIDEDMKQLSEAYNSAISGGGSLSARTGVLDGGLLESLFN